MLELKESRKIKVPYSRVPSVELAEVKLDSSILDSLLEIFSLAMLLLSLMRDPQCNQFSYLTFMVFLFEPEANNPQLNP